MQRDVWKAVSAVAGRQLGLVTWQQATERAGEESSVRRAQTAGLLRPFRHGVLIVAGAPVSAHTHLLAACLAAGPFAAASHLSAGWLHGLGGIVADRHELTVFGDRTPRLADVRCHRSDLVDPTDFSSLAGIPATSLVRTIIDLAGVLAPSYLGRILDDVMPWRASPEAIEEGLVRLGGRRRGCRMLRTLVDDRRGGEGGLEAKWLRRLRRAGFPPPVIHHLVVVNGRVYELDFAWPEQRVAIEVVGFDPRRKRTKFDHERRRNNQVRAAGWVLIDVTANTPLGEVIEVLASALRARSVGGIRH